MKVKNVGSNMTELQLNNGTSVLFSYETPVAAKIHNPFFGDHWVKTEQWYSATTTKHVNKWLEGIEAQLMSQEALNSLVAD